LSILTHARTSDSPEHERALERLVNLYWKPVYCLIRHSWRKSNEEAKDLTQDFFTQMVLEGSLVDDFAGRSSFRAFLKKSVNNFMKNAAQAEKCQKRGGDARRISLSMADFDMGELLPDAQSLTPEQVFDKAWKRVVLAQAMDLLEQRLRADGKEVYFRVFERYDLNSDASYKEVGDAFGLDADTVKNYLTRARQEFRQALMDVVADYVGNDKDLSLEIAELFGV
jgi:RNA polymerase sigma factor (sigma-70 family)